MKQKNLMIYILFIIVIILVPDRVSAAHEYTLNSLCHNSEASDFWNFKECKVEPYAITDESKGFRFTLNNSYIYDGDISISYKDNQKYVCSKRKPNDGSLILSANVCDVYYVRNGYNASCVYKSDDNDIVKVKVNTSSASNIFRLEQYYNGKWVSGDVSKLNFENFSYDGTCPSTVKILMSFVNDYPTFVFGKGNNWVYIKEESTNDVDYPACTGNEKISFKNKEVELFNNYLGVYNNYLSKIKNREFSKYSTTAEAKISEIKSYVTAVDGNFKNVYKKELDNLLKEYKCVGLQSVESREDTALSNLDTLQEAVNNVVNAMEEEAKNVGDTAAASVYNQFLKDSDGFFGDKKVELEYIFDSISVNWDFGKNIKENCGGILGDALLGHIQTVFDWIKILAPILLILFGSLDYGKAVLANDNDAIKKATSNFVKRAIAAIVIFFLPFIINLILNLPGIKDELGVNGDPLCGISWVVKK